MRMRMDGEYEDIYGKGHDPRMMQGEHDVDCCRRRGSRDGKRRKRRDQDKSRYTHTHRERERERERERALPDDDDDDDDDLDDDDFDCSSASNSLRSETGGAGERRAAGGGCCCCGCVRSVCRAVRNDVSTLASTESNSARSDRKDGEVAALIRSV